MSARDDYPIVAILAPLNAAGGAIGEMHAMFDEIDRLRKQYVHIGWARANGCGEVVFRQAGHPANDAGLATAWPIPWHKVYVDREACDG